MKVAGEQSGRPLLLFLHIERAGGTTLHHILRRNYLTFQTLTPWKSRVQGETPVVGADELDFMLKCLPWTRGMGGHNLRCYIDYGAQAGRAARWFTFLRDPVSRYLSHYRYQYQVTGRQRTLDEFLDIPRYHDFMTKKIAGEPDVDRAIDLLERRFAFVGLTDQFDESLVLMRQFLDLSDFDPVYELRNASKRDEEAELDLAELERIRAVNALDQRLYDHVRFELFPRYVDDYAGNFEAQVCDLRTRNSGFRPGKLARWVWAGYRFGIYRQVEKLAARRRQ